MSDRPPNQPPPEDVLYLYQADLPIPQEPVDNRRVWPFHAMLKPGNGFTVLDKKDEKRALRAARKWAQRKGTEFVPYRNDDDRLVIVRSK